MSSTFTKNDLISALLFTVDALATGKASGEALFEHLKTSSAIEAIVTAHQKVS